MTADEFRNLTRNFKDIRPLLLEKKALNQKENKIRRRLITQEKKYKFLSDIVGINVAGQKLVTSIVEYFRSLGFRVEDVDKEFKQEDIKLWVDDKLILIEVTAIPHHLVKEEKAHQISKHIPIQKNKNLNLKVSGIFIVNHQFEKSYKLRNQSPFSSRIKEIASSHQYSLITTVNLLEWYIQLKNGEIDSHQLIDKITA